MNTLNNHSPNLSVDFIPWYQSSPNGLYYYDGIRKANGEVPTVTEVADNANLSVSETYDASYLELEEIYEEMFDNQTFLEELATNMFKAHSEFTGEIISLRTVTRWTKTLLTLVMNSYWSRWPRRRRLV